MMTGPNFASMGALMGDPARAGMLIALMGGQALSAGELARVAGIAPATASGHLAQLQAGGLLAVEQQGRHRYYRLAGPDVAAAVEALMHLADHQAQRRRIRPGPKDAEMRLARVCYDHLAGERGVELLVRLTRQQLITLDDGAVEVTPRGERTLALAGIDVAALRLGKRPVCRMCLDWSERRAHLAGALGAALLERLFALGWARRAGDSRIVRFTPPGEAGFARWFGP